MSNKVADPGPVFPNLVTDKLSEKDVLQEDFTMALGITSVTSVSIRVFLYKPYILKFYLPSLPPCSLQTVGSCWAVASHVQYNLSSKGSLRPTQPHHNGVLNFQTTNCSGIAEVQCMTLSHFPYAYAYTEITPVSVSCTSSSDLTALIFVRKRAGKPMRGDYKAFCTLLI